MTTFGILGPVVLFDGEQEVAIARRQQTVLAYLLMHANHTVPAERMAEELWPGTNGSGKSLQVAVTRLRKALAGELRTVGGGYMLAVEPGDLDAEVFEGLVERGRRELAGGVGGPRRRRGGGPGGRAPRRPPRPRGAGRWRGGAPRRWGRSATRRSR